MNVQLSEGKFESQYNLVEQIRVQSAHLLVLETGNFFQRQPSDIGE